MVVRLRPHIRGGRRLIAAVAFTSLAAGALEGVGVGLLVPLLSLLLGGENAPPMRPITWVQEWFPGGGSSDYVAVFCGLVLAAILLKNLILYLSQLLGAALKRRVAINLRRSLFGRLVHADVTVFEERASGEFANVFLVETHRMQSALDYLLLFCQRASIGFFYLVLLGVISWRLTSITLALVAVVAGVLSFLWKELAQSGDRLTELNRRFAAWVVECFAGIRVIRSTHSEERALSRFDALNGEQACTEERSMRFSNALAPLGETVGVAGAMAIVGLAYVLFVRPGHLLGSHLLGFGFIMVRLLPLVNQLYGLQGQILYLAAGMRSVEQLLQAPQHPTRPFGNRTFHRIRHSLRFTQVSYVYPNGRTALEEVDFEIPSGATVALVGPSGSGKSTVVGLLLRFRAPTGGHIELDGIDYWEYSPGSWHAKVAVVEQEAFLFQGTMAENIAFGEPAVPREKVLQACQVAGLNDLIASLPRGLETIVGERGAALSGGQRQRLAIARALIRDPAFLILDEATSQLDTLSERQMEAALSTACRGKTTLVIAHRLSTVRRADLILVMNGGRLVESGRWEDLEAQGQLFASLVRSAAQSGGVII